MHINLHLNSTKMYRHIIYTDKNINDTSRIIIALLLIGFSKEIISESPCKLSTYKCIIVVHA